MKNIKSLLAVAVIMLAVSFTAKAQLPTFENILLAAGNLVSVQVSDVDVDVVDVIDVTNVLNNTTVDVVALNNILQGIHVENVLNGLLRSADLLNGNQVIVGAVVNVLGGVEQFFIADKRVLRRR